MNYLNRTICSPCPYLRGELSNVQSRHVTSAPCRHVSCPILLIIFHSSWNQITISTTNTDTSNDHKDRVEDGQEHWDLIGFRIYHPCGLVKSPHCRPDFDQAPRQATNRNHSTNLARLFRNDFSSEDQDPQYIGASDTTNITKYRLFILSL